jgi:hypothetical protein
VESTTHQESGEDLAGGNPLEQLDLRVK